MIYLLDSNTCIAYLRKPLGPLAQRILATPPNDLALSAVTVVELHRGAYLSAQVVDNLAKVNAFVTRFIVLPLDTRAGEIAGRVDAELAKQGQRIGPYDTLIAAIALANDLTLVTHNTGEFGRIAGLRLADWEATP
jgi:tRNA(fMet)-specific endonuclease VapC